MCTIEAWIITTMLMVRGVLIFIAVIVFFYFTDGVVKILTN